MKYKKLIKGRRYKFWLGVEEHKGIYRKRYFNKVLKRWHYLFDLGLGWQATPFADSVLPKRT